MIQQVEIFGAHAWFFRDGAAFTVPDAGTASRTSKPGATDPKWLDFGILDVGLAPKLDKKEIKRPAPAVRELEDIVVYGRGMVLKLKKQETNNLDWELLWGCLSLNLDPDTNDGAGGQFNPFERQGDIVKGWLKLEYFGRQSGRAGNNPLVTADLYCAFEYDGEFTPGEEPIEPTILATVLRSTLNTGNLA